MKYRFFIDSYRVSDLCKRLQTFANVTESPIVFMPVLNRQGKMLSIYEFLTSASAFVIAIMLATTTILPESGLAKLRRARNILVPSYFVPIPDSRTEADFARNANRRLFLSCPFHFLSYVCCPFPQEDVPLWVKLCIPN